MQNKMMMTTTNQNVETIQNTLREQFKLTPVMTYLTPLLLLKRTSYSEENEEHVKIMNEYWSYMEPLVSDKHYEEGDNKWQAIGFQGKRPETDFRAMGLLAPICLRYIAKSYPNEVKNRYLQRPYPFSCAGISIVSYIAESMWNSDGSIKLTRKCECILL
jgi:hypothetical protein